MKKFVILAAIAGAIIIPSMPLAADTPTSATIICHAANAGETPDAMMGSSGMTCRKVDLATVHVAIAKMHQAMTRMMGSNPTAEQKAAAADCQNNLNRVAIQYWL